MTPRLGKIAFALREASNSTGSVTRLNSMMIPQATAIATRPV
jgi:hypothetical protein